MINYGKVFLSFLICGEGILGARQLRGNGFAVRGQRSLVNTFPFNANADEHHDHHEAHAASPSQSLESRDFRQGDEGVDVSFGAVAGAAPGPDGKICIDKVEMVEETEYDDI